MNMLRSNKKVSNSSNNCFSLVVTVIFIIVFFEVMPERPMWFIPVKQAEEHIIAVPAYGGFSCLPMQKQEAYNGIEENNNNDANKRIEVYRYNNPLVALSEFKPNFYALLLVDINVPHMNGFELCEKILVIDINVRICFMSSLEIKREGLREIYPSLSLGCFMRKLVTIDNLIKSLSYLSVWHTLTHCPL
jgi:CheY-like chemotaxis protein